MCCGKCACLSIDPVYCHDLRVYGYAPATRDQLPEACGCECHDTDEDGDDE